MTERVVLVAHKDPAYLEVLVPALAAKGFHVLGPVHSARMALALAATAPPECAMVGEELAGRRDGRQLARALDELWGVPTVFIAPDPPQDAA